MAVFVHMQPNPADPRMVWDANRAQWIQAPGLTIPWQDAIAFQSSLAAANAALPSNIQNISLSLGAGTTSSPAVPVRYYIMNATEIDTVSSSGDLRQFSDMGALIDYVQTAGETIHQVQSAQEALALLSTAINQQLITGGLDPNSGRLAVSAPLRPYTPGTAALVPVPPGGPLGIPAGGTRDGSGVDNQLLPGSTSIFDQLKAVAQSGAGYALLIILALWGLFHLLHGEARS